MDPLHASSLSPQAKEEETRSPDADTAGTHGTDTPSGSEAPARILDILRSAIASPDEQKGRVTPSPDAPHKPAAPAEVVPVPAFGVPLPGRAARDASAAMTQAAAELAPIVPVPAPAAPNPAPAAKEPQPAAAEPLPTLAELGGHLEGRPETITAVPQPPAASISDPVPQVSPSGAADQGMDIYRLDASLGEHESSVPAGGASGMIVPPSPLSGIDIDKIKLAPEEPGNPQTFSTSLMPDAPAAPQAAAIPEAAAPDGKKKDFVIPSIHTLRDDMRTIVTDRSMSIVHASVLESEKKRKRQRAEAEGADSAAPRKRRKTPLLLIASAVLIILGGIGAGGFLWYRAERQAPLAVAAAAPSIIFAEQSVPLPLTNASSVMIALTLEQARTSTSLSPGSITRLVPTISSDTSIGGSGQTRNATTAEFFAALGVKLPPELAAALGPDFFLGIHAANGNQAVLIIPVTSYEHAFAGMLAWEPAMSSALTPLFTPAPATVTNADGTIADNAFSDIVIKNYDVRMLADQSGNPSLLYSFPNRNLLVITSSSYTFSEVLARLQAAHQL